MKQWSLANHGGLFFLLASALRLFEMPDETREQLVRRHRLSLDPRHLHRSGTISAGLVKYMSGTVWWTTSATSKVQNFQGKSSDKFYEACGRFRRCLVQDVPTEFREGCGESEQAAHVLCIRTYRLIALDRIAKSMRKIYP